MPVLRIDHAVSDFDAWKQAFDSDPIGRAQSGVRRYRVLRAVGDPNHVMIDLEFDSARDAEASRDALQELWGRVEAQGLIRSPSAVILEAVETKEL